HGRGQHVHAALRPRGGDQPPPRRPRPDGAAGHRGARAPHGGALRAGAPVRRGAARRVAGRAGTTPPPTLAGVLVGCRSTCYHSPSRLGHPTPAPASPTPERTKRRSATLARTPRKWQGARTPSGLKRVRQAERRRAILQPRRSAAKTLVAKAVTTAQTQPESADVAVSLAEAVSALDRAAKSGAIHPNAAARRKSRLT